MSMLVQIFYFQNSLSIFKPLILNKSGIKNRKKSSRKELLKIKHNQNQICNFVPLLSHIPIRS